MANDYWDALFGLYNDTAQGGGSAPSTDFSSLDSRYDQPDAPPGPGGTTGTAPGAQTENSWGQAGGAFARSLIPAVGQAGTAMLLSRMFPGSPGVGRALDLRTQDMQTGSGMAMRRLQNLEANPNSFGLPGDPNDPNTPAGKRLYQIRANQRSASAASGRLETGGHEVREQDAVNQAIANEFNQNYNSGFGNLAAMNPPSQFNYRPPQENPWAKILTTALAPAVGKGIEGAMKTPSANRWFI
mgnify:CR=1 FL=1